MSKLIDYLIDDARESTENEEFDGIIGLTEEEIVKFINQAINRLHSKIVAQHPQVFVATHETSIIGNKENYTIPSHKAYLKNKISQVDYSSTSFSKDYYPLKPTALYNRETGTSGDPDKYIRRGGEILLVPTPYTSKGKLRLTYIPKAKQLNKRRGVVQAVTLSSGTISNLEIGYVNGSSVDSKQLRSQTRFTVVDKYGNIKMENVLLSSIEASSSFDATLSVDPSFTYNDAEIISVGDYVVPGAYSSSHFDLGDEVERYIQLYTEFKILKRDSSADSQEAFQELAEIETDIIDSYKEMSDDIINIPNINEDDDWY